MTDKLYFQDTIGYYGLRVQPTLEDVLQNLKRVRIRRPDRSAKLVALEAEQNLSEDHSMEFDEAQSEDLEDDQAGVQQHRTANVGVILGITNSRKNQWIFNI